MEIISGGSFTAQTRVGSEAKKKYQFQSSSPAKDISFSVKIITAQEENRLNFIQKKILYQNYVKLKIQDEGGKATETLVKIRDLKDRFLLSRKEINEAIQSNRLESLINTRGRVLDSYYQIIDKYDFHRNQVLSKKGQINPPLTASTLKKVVLTALTLTPDQNEMVVKGKKFLVEKDIQKGKVHIIDLNQKTFLGKGANGTAYKVYNYSTAQFEVLKFANQDFADLKNDLALLKAKQARAAASLSMEKKNLDLLHEKAPVNVSSIMSTPRFVTTIEGNPKSETLYLVKEYANNAFTATTQRGLLGRLSKPEQQKAIAIGGFELIKGLKHFEAEGFGHGDIKPENIFLKKSPNSPNIKFVFADFAGGKFHDEPTEFTQRFYPLTDQFKPFKDHSKRDVFATGVSLYFMITGKYPYETYPKNYSIEYYRGRPKFDDNYSDRVKQELAASGFDPELCALIEKMIHPTIDYRIDIHQLTTQWEKIVRQKYQPPIANAYRPNLSSEDAKKIFTSIENNPRIPDKTCHLIRDSQNNPGFLVLSTYSVNPKTKTNQFIEALIQIDSLNERIAVFDKEKKVSEWIPFTELSFRFGATAHDLISR